MADMTEGKESLKLLLISDLHCVGDSMTAFSRLVGEAKSTGQIQDELRRLLDRYAGTADYVLAGGDFTDNGRPHQYEAVMSVLLEYPPDWFCVIPGNHDVANFNNMESHGARMRRFKKYLGDHLPVSGGPLNSKEYFPYVRELGGGFALIGLDSTMARTAQGRLGARQLDRLRLFLSSQEHSGKHKIVFLHHDATGDTKIFNGFEIHYGNVLTDSDEFLDVLRRHLDKEPPAGLTVVNGHTHLKRIDTETLPGATVITVPSFGSRFEEDYVAVELFRGGGIRELESDSESARKRRFRKLGRIIFPEIHT